MVNALLILAVIKMLLFFAVVFFAKGDTSARAVALGLAVFEILNMIYFFIKLG